MDFLTIQKMCNVLVMKLFTFIENIRVFVDVLELLNRKHLS